MLRSGIKKFFEKFRSSPLSKIDPSAFLDIPEKPLVVLITSYNNKKWVSKNLTSVFNQLYTNYRTIYIDDASPDETSTLVESLIKKNPSQANRFRLIRNQNRKGGLCNLYEGVWSCRDEEIIVNLDGDDWFASPYVLKTINQAYSTQNIWLTHGTLIEYPKKALGWSIPIPPKIIEEHAFRTHRCPSHLKTFYTWLFKKIRVEDLKINGEFFPMTWDQAIMFPMLEMAAERHSFLSEILYVYNMSNPINDHKVNATLQRDLEKLIRSKPKYTRLLEAPL
jgi:glycosyltransferase involved in cell wall biosynthesis